MYTQSKYLHDSYFEDHENFSWPIDRDASVSVRDIFIEKVLDFYKAQPKHTRYTEYYPVLCMYWSAHVLQFFNAGILRANNKKNINLIDPIQNAILNSEPIPEPVYVTQLQNGVKDIKVYLKPLRLVKHSLAKAGDIQRKPDILTDYKSDIIVTTTGPIIYSHAKMTGQKVIYKNQSHWFYPLSDSKKLNINDAAIDAQNLWDILIASFGDHSNIINVQSIKEWFIDVFGKSLIYCHAYSQRLLESPKTLPSNFWIGSGSSLWDRILKNIVYNTGGHVTGHDHGAGAGHLISKSRTLAECFSCNEFVTLGDPELFQSSIYKPFLINGSPKIISLNKSSKAILTKIENRSGKKVLIMPSAPESKIPRFIGAAMEPVQADFLNRLFLNLKSNGYEVYIKPHPELKPLIEDEYFTENGAHILRNSIKEAFALCDIVLFQHIHSTTFREAIESGKYIGVIDMQYDKWTPEANEAVSERCSLIPAYYDESNRIQLEWNDLKHKIEKSRELDSAKFFEMYFS